MYHLCGSMHFREDHTVYVLGRDKGYAVKYNPLPEGVPEGTPEGKGWYSTVYRGLSPNMEIIPF